MHHSVGRIPLGVRRSVDDVEFLVGIGTVWFAAAAAVTFGLTHAMAHSEPEVRRQRVPARR